MTKHSKVELKARPQGTSGKATSLAIGIDLGDRYQRSLRTRRGRRNLLSQSSPAHDPCRRCRSTSTQRSAGPGRS